MDNPDIFILKNKAFENNNKILFDLIKKLNNIINELYNNKPINIITKQIKNIIIIMNKIANENHKNNEEIRKDIKNLHKDMIANFQNLNNNNLIYKTKIYKYGKYIGETKNGLREGKGIMYYNDGNRYDGEWKNDGIEGKGIYYWNDGERYEADWKNGLSEWKGIYFWNNGERYEGDYKNGEPYGKGVYYYKNGNRYEGDIKNGLREGKGIMYYDNGDRKMGNYLNDKAIGKHVIMFSNGNIATDFY